MNKYPSYILIFIIFFITPFYVFAKPMPLTVMEPVEIRHWATVWYNGVFDPSFSKEIYLMYVDRYGPQNPAYPSYVTKGNDTAISFAGAPIGVQDQMNQSMYLANYIKRRIIDQQTRNLAKDQPIIKQVNKVKEKLGNVGLNFSSGEGEKKTELRTKFDIVRGFFNISLLHYIANASMNYNMNNKLLYFSIDKALTRTVGTSFRFVPKTNDITFTLGKTITFLSIPASLSTVICRNLNPGGNTGLYETLAFRF